MLCKCLLVNVIHFFSSSQKRVGLGLFAYIHQKKDGTFTNKDVESFMVCNAYICVYNLLCCSNSLFYNFGLQFDIFIYVFQMVFCRILLILSQNINYQCTLQNKSWVEKKIKYIPNLGRNMSIMEEWKGKEKEKELQKQLWRWFLFVQLIW